MKYCQSISDELTFNFDKVVPCCNCYSYNAPKYIDLGNKESDKNSVEQINIIETKKNILNNINENIENFSCRNCIHLKDDDTVTFDDITNKKYSSISLRHWNVCNKSEENRYSPIQFIRNAYEKNLIDIENLVIRFEIDDIMAIEDFDEYIDIFQQYGFKTIHFSTNNIVYQPKIEQILKQGKGSLNLSIDSGTKKTYNQIKKVDKFDEVILNLKKYLESGIHPDAISIHYIMIKDYNDNKNEIKAFLNLMKEIGISTVGVRIDHKDLDSYLLGNSPIEVVEKYKELVTYFHHESEELNLKLDNDLCIEQNFALKKSNEKKENNSFIKNIFNKIFH